LKFKNLVYFIILPVMPTSMSTIITGATRGIGLNLAQKLVSQGKSVVLTGRNEQKLSYLASSMGTKYVVLDMLDVDCIRSLPRKLELQGIRSIATLVNNAGRLQYGWYEDNFSRSMQVNALGPLQLIQTLAPLIQTGGKIINVTDAKLSAPSELSYNYQNLLFNTHFVDEIYDIKFHPDDEFMKSRPTSIYSFSKAALNHIGSILCEHEDLNEENIKIIGVCPGCCPMRTIETKTDSIVCAITNDRCMSGLIYRDGIVQNLNQN
jgi:NAD(P)-dependent dehydrogenase (short-subunit alcohol dehydrogenase family)